MSVISPVQSHYHEGSLLETLLEVAEVIAKVKVVSFYGSRCIIIAAEIMAQLSMCWPIRRKWQILPSTILLCAGCL